MNFQVFTTHANIVVTYANMLYACVIKIWNANNLIIWFSKITQKSSNFDPSYKFVSFLKDFHFLLIKIFLENVTTNFQNYKSINLEI